MSINRCPYGEPSCRGDLDLPTANLRDCCQTDQIHNGLDDDAIRKLRDTARAARLWPMVRIADAALGGCEFRRGLCADVIRDVRAAVDAQIDDLRIEAAAAGDLDTVHICLIALGSIIAPHLSREDARRACAMLIREGRGDAAAR